MGWLHSGGTGGGGNIRVIWFRTSNRCGKTIPTKKRERWGWRGKMMCEIKEERRCVKERTVSEC